MALSLRHRRTAGLGTPVKDFPKRLNAILRAFLDKEDPIAKRDWRQLVDLIGLSEGDREIVKQSVHKTEVALSLWQQHVGPDTSNGYALLQILQEMGRVDAIKEVQRFLGKTTGRVPEQMRQTLEAIADAARMGDTETLTELLHGKTGKELDEDFKDEFESPLHAAVYYGHLPAVKLLVEKGFDINKLDYLGKTPRDWVDEDDIEMMAFLDEEAKKQPEAATSRQHWPAVRSSLDEATFARDIKRMEELLKTSHDVDLAAAPGRADLWTPLHTAARNCDINAVKLLVEYGASIGKLNEDGYTAEDLARRFGYDEVLDYLKMKRELLEKERREVYEMMHARLPGQSITVYLAEEKEIPFEFQIKSISFTEILKGISDMLGVEIKALKNRGNYARITQARDLLFANDVIACTDRQLDVPAYIPPESPLTAMAQSSEEDVQQLAVSIQHFSTYWSRPPERLEFNLDDEYNDILRRSADILRRSSGRLELQVHGLYTSEKFSKIKQTGVLSTKQRVVAAADSDRVREESGTLVHPKFFGPPHSKLFGSDGGTLFDHHYDVLIEVPPGAVEHGKNVKVMVQVAAPDKRMNLCSEWGRVYHVGLPVYVQTEPRYTFHQPVKLRIPHCGINEPNFQSGSIAVLTAGTSVPLRSQLEFQRLPGDQFEVRDNHVVIQSFKFSWFWVFTESAVLSRRCVVALYTPSDEDARQAQDIHVRMAVFPNLHLYSTAADEVIARSDTLAGHTTRYVLRARKTFMVTSQGKIDVEIRNKGNVDWKITPATLGMTFDEIWNNLYTSNRYVYDVDVCMRWLPRDDKKNSQPIELEFFLSGQGGSSHTCTLGLFIDLPGSDRPTAGVLLPAVEEKLIGLLDSVPGEENDRGWYSLGLALGMTRDQLRALKRERHPTKIILNKFAARHGEMEELKDALTHLGYEMPT